MLTADPADYMSDEQVAQIVGVSTDTLGKWRTKKSGPGFIRISGKQVRYHRADVITWLESRREGAESGNRETGNGLVLPVHASGRGVQGEHRFGGYRTKSEKRGTS
jgi:excisionase family DNA binding protein